LSIASPLITVCVSGLWLFAKNVYIDPYINERKRRVANQSMDRVLSDARANAAQVLADPNASDAHKHEVQKMVEDLEKLRLRKITERMEILFVE